MRLRPRIAGACAGATLLRTELEPTPPAHVFVRSRFELLFAKLVIMAVITTLMASPIFERLVGTGTYKAELDNETARGAV